MCGIAGYFSSMTQSADALSRMLSALQHRGPDSESEYSSCDVQLGMRRLAINDLDHGQQPLYNQDKTVVVMYNGEIYNSPHLRNQLLAEGYAFRSGSDGEVICHLYEAYGEQVFGYLDGMFAIALWDEMRKTLFLARDQAGEKPLYYAAIDQGQGLVFASEIQALRQFDGLDLTLDRQALWDFPTFLWIPEPATVYEQVRALPRGHVLKISVSGRTVAPYRSRLGPFADSALDDRDAITETRRVVEQAVHSRLLSDVPVGSFLSGGLDSSIVATLATQALGPIDTFSVGFEPLSDPYHGTSDESDQAAAYAARLQSRHHRLQVTARSFRDSLDTFCHHGDQPFAVSSGLGILAVAKAAREAGIKVLLSGDCADECFGGYSWYPQLSLPYEQPLGDGPASIVSYQNFGIDESARLTRLAGYTAQQRAWAWHYYAHEQEKATLFAADWSAGLRSSLRHFEAFDPSQTWLPARYVANDRAFYLPNEMLRKLDRMTMAHSVEGRVPFAAPAVLAHAERLTDAQRVRGNILKWALRKAFSDILPADVVERPKHGFNVPIDHWLKHEWNDLLQATFAPSSALRRQGLIGADASQVAERMLWDRERLNGHSLFCFIMLNRWLEQSA